MTSFIELVKEMHKGIFIYSVRVSDDPSTDERAAWVRTTCIQTVEERADSSRSLEMLINKSRKSPMSSLRWKN